MFQKYHEIKKTMLKPFDVKDDFSIDKTSDLNFSCLCHSSALSYQFGFTLS